MCSPCQLTSKAECRSQSSIRFLTAACLFCQKGKRSCSGPHPSWLTEAITFMQDRSVQGSVESEYFHLAALCRLPETMLTIIYFSSAQNRLKDIDIMLHALCKKASIDPTTLEGYTGASSAQPSRSPAPSARSTTSSMGKQMTTLDVAGGTSGKSSRASSRSGRSGSSSKSFLYFLTIQH